MMLQAGSVLITYRIDKPPEEMISGTSEAQRIADHDIKFLSYEGPVNKGLGDVAMCERGKYTIVEETSQFTRIEFCGNIISGRFVLKLAGDDKYTLEREK